MIERAASNRFFLQRLVILILVGSPLILKADWEPLPPLPEPNGGFACGTYKGGIVLAGGTNWKNGEKRWLRSVIRFNTETKLWEKPGKPLPSPLAYGVSGGVESGESLAILGGSDGTDPRQIIVSVNGQGFSTEDAPELSKNIVLSAGGLIGDLFLVVGGTDDAANIGGLTKEAFAYSLKEKTQTPLPNYPGRPFGIAASAVAGEELFVFGGANWNQDDETVSNTVDSFAFSLKTGQWRKLKPYPLAARAQTAVSLDANRLYIAGGYGGDDDTFLSDAFIYDIRSDTYRKATPLPYAATVGLVFKDGFVYCLGGEDRMKSRTDAFWRVRAEKL